MRRPAGRERPGRKPKAQRSGTDPAALRRAAGGLRRSPAAPASREWLASLKAKAAGKALKALIARASARLRRLIGGIAEAAPYLWDLVRADPARFVRLLGGRSGCARSPRSSPRRDAPPTAARTPDEVMRILRRMKAEAALLDRARRYRRRLAGCARDARAHRCRRNGAWAPRCAICLREAARRGKLAPAGSEPIPKRAPATSCSPWARWAAMSSIISSDIDLMVFFDPAAADARAGRRAGAVLCAADARPREASAGAHRRTATCFASICGCAPIRPRPRSRSRPRRRSITTKAAARTGSARR